MSFTKVEARAALAGLEVDHHVAVLPAAARLLDVLRLDVRDGLLHPLAVGDLGLARVRLDLVLALQAVDDDLQVELAHAVDERLPALLVGVDRNDGSSIASFWSPTPILSWSALVFGSIAMEITGSGKVIRSSTMGCFSSQRVSPVRESRSPLHRGDDAGEDVLDVFALVGVHEQQAADALVLVAGGC
jgi:hypothetical protein